jgi:formamidase
MRSLSIAALQTAPDHRDPEQTLERLARTARTLRRTIDHVQLLLLPELHLCAVPGLLDEPAGSRDELAFDVPGPLTDRLGEIAIETGLWLVPGTIYELAGGGAVHNTAVVISPEGELVARYRKVFPWQPYETTEPGDRFVTFDIPGVGRVGLAICYDGFFPEAFRQLAWMGAEVVLQPTLTTTSDRAAELITVRANAIFNQLYVVNVNAASPAAVGRSLIADPEGRVRVEAGSGEELLTDVLDLDAVTRTREFGTGAVSRMWAHLDSGAAAGVQLPMYGIDGVRPRATAR